MIDEFIALDLETTGFHRKYDDIIEIGAVKVKRKEGAQNTFYVAGEFSHLIRTWKMLDPKVTAITGITDAMLDGKPSSKQVLELFLRFRESAPLVLQNGGFDMPFLANRIERRLNKTIDRNNYYDTVQLGRKLVPHLENHRLNTLAKHYGIINPRHHRALNDARVTADVFLCMIGSTPVCTLPMASSLDQAMHAFNKFNKQQM